MVYRFGEFKLDMGRFELRSDGTALDVEPKVLEVLAFLLARREGVVTKEELVQGVWRGQFISDSAVSRAIREVRRALGDSAAESRWVKTIYGRGFRFVGEVTEADESGISGPYSAEARSGDRPRRTITPLPLPLTPLLGRDQELEEIGALLLEHRLVTLTGTGGTGKTRLALAVARDCQEKFAEGTIFVPLSEVGEARGVGTAIARALGVSDAKGESTLGALQSYIGQGELLLVLDNFEHVLPASALIVELLQVCPGLTALVTSRSVLQAAGEREVPVSGLALPDKGSDVARLESSPSVALFIERATAVLREFSPESREMEYIAEICRRLDGLPLAIELAAARIKVLSPHDLWRMLAERLDLLSSREGSRPDRHRTLEQALSWSHDLCSEEEQRLFRRLAVFSGGFSLSSAVKVCAGDGEDLVNLLASLVDKSLVIRTGQIEGEARFGLLETTRTFAADLLEESGEAEALRTAHAAWMLETAQEAEKELAGGRQRHWLERLDAEHANILASLDWARSGGDLAMGLETAAALGRYWSARGLYREGRRLLGDLIYHPGSADQEPQLLTDALIALGMLDLVDCDYPTALQTLDRALVTARELDDPRRMAHTLNHLGWVLAQGPELDRASSLSREALELCREAGDERGMAVALNNLGWVSLFCGEVARAEETFESSLGHRRAAGDDRGAAYALTNLAFLRLYLSDRWEEVPGWFREARSLLERLGDVPLQSWLHIAEGFAAIRHGDPASAIDHLEESTELEDEVGQGDSKAWGLMILGDAYADLDDQEAAGSLYTASLEMWDRLGMVWGKAQVFYRQARLLDSQGDVDGARDLWSRSLALSEELGDSATAEICHRGMGSPQ